MFYLAIKRSIFLFILLCCVSSYAQNTAHHFPVTELSKLHSYYAPVQNGRIEYYKFGSGSPIILIAGYATDVSSWDRELLAALADNHEVIVLNNRNVGGSLVHSSRYGTEDLANDIYQLIKDLNLKKPAVLGISMGGMIAQQLALLHQEQLGALILINTSIAGKQAVHPNPEVEKKMLAVPSNTLQRFMIDMELLFPASWRMQMAYDLVVDRFQPERYQAINLAAIKSQQQQLVFKWLRNDRAAEKMRELKLPVLILNGQADIVIPPVNSEILARTIPHARLVRWQDGGHAMIYQYPDQIAEVVSQFIAESG